MKKIALISLLPLMLLTSCLTVGDIFDQAIDQAAEDAFDSAAESVEDSADDESAAARPEAAAPVNLEPTEENVIAAVQACDAESLEKILADIDDVKTIVGDDVLLLHMAEEAAGVHGQKNPVAELLVAKKAYILQRDEQGRSWERLVMNMELAATPRHDFILDTVGDKFVQRMEAIRSDDLEEFRKYEEYGPLDGPLLYEVTKERATGILAYMVDAGSDVNYSHPRTEETALFTLCGYVPYDKTQYDDLLPMFESLLDAGADPDIADSHGMTPLVNLMKTELQDNPDDRGDPRNLVLALVDTGADPDIPDSTGRTALEYAVGDMNFPNPAIVEILLDAGAEINERIEATLQRNVGILGLLVANGADPHVIAQANRAFYDGDEQMAYFRLMLSAGADVNDFALNTTVLYAENLEYLVDQGADLTKRYFRYEYTLLHLAAQSGTADSVRLLIDRGMDVNALDSKDRTPMDSAGRSQKPTYREEITRLLRDAGGVPGSEL